MDDISLGHLVIAYSAADEASASGLIGRGILIKLNSGRPHPIKLTSDPVHDESW